MMSVSKPSSAISTGPNQVWRSFFLKNSPAKENIRLVFIEWYTVEYQQCKTNKDTDIWWFHTGLLIWWIQRLPLARENRVQSQITSYLKTQKWYLMLPCLTLIIMIYISRLKMINQGKRVAPSPTSRFSSNWKGSLMVALDYDRPTSIKLMVYYHIY